MIEIPESATIGKQASETLKGKRIAHVIESNRRNTPIVW